MGDDEDKLDTDAEDQPSPSDVGDSPAADDGSNTMLQNCFSAIVDTLSHHNPRYVISPKVTSKIVTSKNVTSQPKVWYIQKNVTS